MAKNILQATEAFELTPSADPVEDHANNIQNSKLVTLYIGVTGDVDVQVGSNRIVYKNVPVGFFPVLVSYVYPTTTTATELIAHSDGGAN
jgi:hypothetical protein